jgi:phosphocarrier protein HPr
MSAADDCPPNPGAPSGALEQEIPIVNQKGLHARASAKFVQVAEKFEADIKVSRCGETVSGTSIMGLLLLAAAKGSSIHVSATGKDAAAAVQAIAQLCADKFGEEE